jgi:hypothetical protein
MFLKNSIGSKPVIMSLLVAGMVFIAFSWARIDVIQTLGLDILFSSESFDVRFTRGYVAFRIITNIGISLLAGFISYFILRSYGTNDTLSIHESEHQRSPRLPDDDARDLHIIPTKLAESRTLTIILLGKRISNLTSQATTIRWTILTTLIAGLFLIIFSGYLSSFDTTLSNISAKLEAERQEALNNLNRISISRAATSEGSQTASKLEDAYSYSMSRLQALDKSYAELTSAIIKQAADRADNRPYVNWSGTILRLGVIGLLVFLTQILVSLYRYNVRLIVFYSALRDALLLCGDDLEKLQDYLKALFPANLDFGQEPSHPLQNLVGLFGWGRRASKRADRHAASDSPPGADPNRD